MFRRCVPLLLVFALVVPLAGCGGSDKGASTSGSGGQAAAVLNGWSDTTLSALTALQARAKAFSKRDKQAYDQATTQLQAQLQKIQQFPVDAQKVKGSAAEAVAADAAAWKAWATTASQILSQKSVDNNDVTKAGQLVTDAVSAHAAAYKAAGAKVPAAFQQQSGQQSGGASKGSTQTQSTP